MGFCNCGFYNSVIPPDPCPVHSYSYFPNYVFPNYTTTTAPKIEWSRPEYTGRHR